MRAKFTKGPWSFRQPFNQEMFAIFYSEPGRTKRLDNLRGGFSQSDAHLIAAAPELYEALGELLTKAKALVEWVNRQEVIGVSNYDIAFSKSEAALAKAEGAQPTLTK